MRVESDGSACVFVRSEKSRELWIGDHHGREWEANENEKMRTTYCRSTCWEPSAVAWSVAERVAPRCLLAQAAKLQIPLSGPSRPFRPPSATIPRRQLVLDQKGQVRLRGTRCKVAHWKNQCWMRVFVEGGRSSLRSINFQFKPCRLGGALGTWPERPHNGDQPRAKQLLNSQAPRHANLSLPVDQQQSQPQHLCSPTSFGAHPDPAVVALSSQSATG